MFYDEIRVMLQSYEKVQKGSRKEKPIGFKRSYLPIAWARATTVSIAILKTGEIR